MDRRRDRRSSLDGPHTKAGCAADLAIASQLTDVIAAHDYGLACFPGITEAVLELAGWSIVEQAKTTVILKRKLP